MSVFFARYKFLILIYLAYLVGFLIIQPFGEYPLNDDWSYTWSVKKFISEGIIDIGGWPAMTLATHILWGSLFVKTFGFSFVTLRISTWVSVIIGMFFFEKLLFRISLSRQVAAIGVFFMLFNPIFFNVSHSFMTDANFFTILVIAINLGYDFFARPRLLTFLSVFLFGFVLMMIRQYGIIIPGCMMVASFFLKEKKWQYVVLALLLFVAVYYGFLLYEGYLKSILPDYASYKFTGNINPLTKKFWDSLEYGVETRHRIVAIHALFHTLPLTLIFVHAIIKYYRFFAVFIVALVALLVYRLYCEYPLQVGNVFVDTTLGADTTYETLKGTYGDSPHFYLKWFEKLTDVFKYVFITISFVVLLFLVKKIVDEKGRELVTTRPPHLIFMVSLVVAYIILILITESFFDRYEIPVIAMSFAIFAYCARVYQPSLKLFVIPALLWFYVSVFGTRDYFQLNNLKWQAYNDIQRIEKVPGKKINGGFEIGMWNDGNISIWSEFMFLHTYDYLIQFKKEDSFAVFKEYPYRRYYPFMKDTLRAYKRNVFAAGKQ